MAKVQIGDIVNMDVFEAEKGSCEMCCNGNMYVCWRKIQPKVKEQKVTAQTRMAIILQGFPRD